MRVNPARPLAGRAKDVDTGACLQRVYTITYETYDGPKTLGPRSLPPPDNPHRVLPLRFDAGKRETSCTLPALIEIQDVDCQVPAWHHFLDNPPGLVPIPSVVAVAQTPSYPAQLSPSEGGTLVLLQAVPTLPLPLLPSNLSGQPAVRAEPPSLSTRAGTVKAG